MRITPDAYRAGAAALVLAFLAGCIDLRLALVPLALFLFLCLVAPFLHRFSFYLPVISRGNRREKAVALTFDDGPDPLTTLKLLELLNAHAVTATFFVTGENAQAYPDLVRAIVQGGHTVGNHSFSHNPFLIFKGARHVYREIARTQKVLGRLGVQPLVYRPPVGITYPALGGILSRLNLLAVNFSCRARDWGNRRIKGMARRILAEMRAGDIIMLHDLGPAKKRCVATWLMEVDQIIKGVRAAGFEIYPLQRLIGRPVDRKPASAGSQAGSPPANPAGSHCASKAGPMPGNRR